MGAPGSGLSLSEPTVAGRHPPCEPWSTSLHLDEPIAFDKSAGHSDDVLQRVIESQLQSGRSCPMLGTGSSPTGNQIFRLRKARTAAANCESHLARLYA